MLSLPDAYGSHELFIWITHIEQLICSNMLEVSQPEPPRPEPARSADPDRVPFSPAADFAFLTRRALILADDVAPPYNAVLRLLKDCEPFADFADKQRRGASYKQLAAVAHQAGMTKTERIGWYKIAESVPISDRHAGHLLGRLKRRAA